MVSLGIFIPGSVFRETKKTKTPLTAIAIPASMNIGLRISLDFPRKAIKPMPSNAAMPLILDICPNLFAFPSVLVRLRIIAGCNGAQQ